MTPPATAADTLPPELDALPPRGADLPYDDGVPLESPWHRDAMNMLIENVDFYRLGRDDYYAGGNMFFYYSTSQAKTHDFRGPDVFVVNGADRTRPRNSWVVWEEGGRVPNVIVEMVSESTRRIDLIDKLELYTRTLLIPEYFCVDPVQRRIVGWRRYKASVEPIEDEDGRLWCSELEAYIGWWEGYYHAPPTGWFPRLFDVHGNLIPIFKEAARAEATKAQAEATKAQAEASKAQVELAAEHTERKRRKPRLLG